MAIGGFGGSLINLVLFVASSVALVHYSRHHVASMKRSDWSQTVYMEDSRNGEKGKRLL